MYMDHIVYHVDVRSSQYQQLHRLHPAKLCSTVQRSDANLLPYVIVVGEEEEEEGRVGGGMREMNIQKE
jgi:hypothetical protein